MSTINDSPVTPGMALATRLRRYGNGAQGFFAWWRHGLAAWLPSSWRSLFGLSQDRLLLAQSSDGLHLRWQEGTGLHELAQLPSPLPAAGLDGLLNTSLARLPRWLVLPATDTLRRRLVLPAAAAERLRDVVGFEIDRQTPFVPGAVHFDARVLGRREDGQLDVELIAAPRARVAEVRSAMGGIAEGLAGIDVVDAEGRPLGVNLLPAESRQNHRDPQRRWNLLLAVIALLALIALAWQLLENRRAAAAAFSARAEAQAAGARRVATQRQQLADLVDGAAFLDRNRAVRPAALEVIAELSRRLPDNTYLEKLSIEGNRLVLIGLSTEAPGLVARLEGAKLWRTPALSGALQTDTRSRRDRFTLTAELVGGAPAAAATKPAKAKGDADAQ